MCSDERFGELEFARCILAVADQDDSLSSRLLTELFLAGKIDGVIDRRAASGLELVNGALQQSHIVRVVLNHSDRTIEADDKCQVFFTQNGFQKADRGQFLFIEHRPDAGACVDQECQCQG